MVSAIDIATCDAPYVSIYVEREDLERAARPACAVGLGTSGNCGGILHRRIRSAHDDRRVQGHTSGLRETAATQTVLVSDHRVYWMAKRQDEDPKAQSTALNTGGIFHDTRAR